MWIYISIGIVLFFFIFVFSISGALFFNALRRTTKSKKNRGIDTSSLFPAIEPYRDTINEGKSWFLEQTHHSVEIRSHDGLLLHAHILNAKQAVGTILLMHGYRGTGLSDFSAVFRFYHEHGYNIVVPDERACGKSEGTYISLGILERHDCKRWTEWIVQQYGQDLPIFLDGVSMGASTILMATALDLPQNVRGIIADCGFTSPWEIVRAVVRATGSLPMFPFAYVAELYARVFGKFSFRETSTTVALKTCKIPIFFAHGKKDRFVPYSMSEENYAVCTSKKEFFTVENAEHGMCYLLEKEEYENRILAFFKECLCEDSPQQ